MSKFWQGRVAEGLVETWQTEAFSITCYDSTPPKNWETICVHSDVAQIWVVSARSHLPPWCAAAWASAHSRSSTWCPPSGTSSPWSPAARQSWLISGCFRASLDDDEIMFKCLWLFFYRSRSCSVHNSRTHFSRVFVSAALLVSSLLSSMSLNLLYRFSIFLLTSCKIMLALRQDIHLMTTMPHNSDIWETLMSAYRNKCRFTWQEASSIAIVCYNSAHPTYFKVCVHTIVS